MPFLSTVVIGQYIARDRTIKGNRIDRYMDNHQEALNAGVVLDGLDRGLKISVRTKQDSQYGLFGRLKTIR